MTGICSLSRFYYANLSNFGNRNGVTRKDMIDISSLRVQNRVTGTCVSLIFAAGS